MPALRKVIVVFKTHFDLGFTDLPDQFLKDGNVGGSFAEYLQAIE